MEMEAEKLAQEPVEEHGLPSQLSKERLAHYNSQKNKTEISTLVKCLGWIDNADQRSRIKPSPRPLKARVVGQYVDRGHEEQHCVFFKLPAKVRNRIYELVLSAEAGTHRATQIDAHDQSSRNLEALSEDHGIDHDSHGKSMSTAVQSQNRPTHLSSLLLVCRKINQENAIIAFRIHRFVVGMISVSEGCLIVFSIHRQQVEPFPAALVGSLTSIVITNLPNWDSLTQTRTQSFRLFPNLKESKFGISEETFAKARAILRALYSPEIPYDMNRTVRVRVPRSLVTFMPPGSLSHPGQNPEIRLRAHIGHRPRTRRHRRGVRPYLQRGSEVAEKGNSRG